MVQTNYDIFNRQETPPFVLCNPNGDQIYSLDSASKKEVARRFNAISEVKITVPKEVNGVDTPAYEHLKQKRLILVGDDESGYFVITNVSEDSSGSIPSKVVSAMSYDYTLVARKLNAFGGTFPLYDILTPEDSLLGTILEYIPSWSIGDVDAELLTRYRTFDVSNTNIYEFLVTNVEEAYNCIIIFDTVNKTISAKTLDNVTTETDVFMSHHNLIKSSSFREISDELSTALYVVGGGDLSINAVNPLGSNLIYNFDYYKSTDWMSQSLIDALTTWESLIVANQTTYANTLTSMKIANGELIILNGELDTLEAEYLALEAVQKVRIEASQDLTAINVELAAKQVEIDSKETEITSKESEITSLRATLEGINDTLSFDNNFTVAELEELDFFINENTYQNENIVQLDSDSAVEVQENAQILYDQAIEVLERVSQPRYEFDINSVNMLSLKAFESLNSQLELGSIVYMQNASSQDLSLILLEIKYDYESPGKFNLTFSNRLRLDNGAFIYSDLLGQAVKSGTSVKFDSAKWANWSNDYKNDVTSFITSSLDASTNKLISGDNEEIEIYSNGLRGRHWDSDTETYDDEQIWLTSNMIAFTEDNWNSSSMGIGRIDFNGTPVYGVVAEAIVGNLIAGNELEISNDANNFILNENGAFLNNASFELTTDSGKNRITLDADVGIKIESNPAGTWSDSFYADTSGNIIFAGTLSGVDGDFSGSITADSGFIGGMEITSDGIDVDSTHYIHNDGEIKWGGLWLKTSGDAQFDGDIYATKLVGTVDWSQIINTPIPTSQFNGGSGYSASGIDTGNMSGNRVYGGTISGGGVSIGLDSYGILDISGSNYIYLNASDVRCRADFLVQDDLTVSDDATVWGTFKIGGNLVSGGYYGSTTTFGVGGAYSAKTLTFRNGILTGWSFG